MVKILMGVLAAVVIAVGGLFGFGFYTQHRIAGELDAAFDQIRAAGGKAGYAKVSFDLWTHTLAIADIAIETATQPPVSVKIANLTASGVRQPEPARFAADAIEASDMEVATVTAAQPGFQIGYKFPRLVIKDYSGPASLKQPQASASVIDTYRSLLEQFATVSAASVSFPSIAGTINAGPLMSGDFTYSGVLLQDIKNGKIANTKVDRVAYTINTQQAGKSDKMTAEIVDLASRDFDAAAAIAVLNPQSANDERYYRFYGQSRAGAYTVTSAQGLRMRIDGFTVDEVSVKPSRLQIPPLLALITRAGSTPPTPAQARELFENVASIYEGIRIGSVEMRGLAIETPQGPVKLAAIRFNLENGKFGEVALENLDGRSPQGPVKIGRFALKSLDISSLLRMSAQFANPAQPPSPDKFLAFLTVLQGIELKGIVAPYKNTSKIVTMDNFDLSWGEFVGSLPGKVRLTGKMTMPVDRSDPGLQPLAAVGMSTLTVDTDLGANWAIPARTMVLDPVALELGGLFKATARISLANVRPEVFSTNRAVGGAMIALVESGVIEFTLRDTGGLDLAILQYGRAQNLSVDAARAAIIENIRTSGQEVAAGNPEVAAVVEALVRFIETPRTALTIKLTPVGKVPLMEFFQSLDADPAAASSKFHLEASTAL